jgi:ssDNA-specific exonuclease RecJ
MSGIIIPSSDKDRQAIKGAMSEISNAYTRMEAEREFVREALKELEDKVGIKAKYLRKMSRIFHKQNLLELTSEMEDLEGLYEAIK